MPSLTGEQRKLCRQATEWFKGWYLTEKYQTLNNVLPSAITREADLAIPYSLLDSLKELCTIPGPRSAWDEDELPGVEVSEDLLPCLKRVLIAKRRHEANNAELLKQKTHNPLVIDLLEKDVKPLDAVLSLPWLKPVRPLQMPHITDFISIQSLENENGKRFYELRDRQYDEKFHILQAPNVLIGDLRYYREKCETRGAAVTLAYLDIDDFKRLNTKYGEVQIDRRVLPVFMRALEAQVFQHGYAYRCGGDEYVCLIPNLSRSLTISFLEELRIRLSSVRYGDIPDTTTVSIGFCYVDADCPLTDREIEESANRAKNFAKRNAKNCIAMFRDTLNFGDEDLEIVRTS